MTQDEAYKAWWHNEGSGILPLPNEDMEEFAHRMTKIAWSNGAFKEREACLKIAEDQFFADFIALTTNPTMNATAVAIANRIRLRENYRQGETD